MYEIFKAFKELKEFIFASKCMWIRVLSSQGYDHVREITKTFTRLSLWIREAEAEKGTKMLSRLQCNIFQHGGSRWGIKAVFVQHVRLWGVCGNKRASRFHLLDAGAVFSAGECSSSGTKLHAFYSHVYQGWISGIQPSDEPPVRTPEQGRHCVAVKRARDLIQSGLQMVSVTSWIWFFSEWSQSHNEHKRIFECCLHKSLKSVIQHVTDIWPLLSDVKDVKTAMRAQCFHSSSATPVYVKAFYSYLIYRKEYALNSCTCV